MLTLIQPRKLLDLSIQWQPSHLRKASFTCGIDNATGTVRCAGGGIWREADAQLYFDQQMRIVAEARRRFGSVRLLMDVRDWIVEDAHSVSQFQAMNAQIYSMADRLAAVVKSSADKPHPRAALAIGTRESFLSPNAAETWLHAYSAESIAAPENTGWRDAGTDARFSSSSRM